MTVDHIIIYMSIECSTTINISLFCHLTERNNKHTPTNHQIYQTIELYQITNQSINQLFKQVNELL